MYVECEALALPLAVNWAVYTSKNPTSINTAAAIMGRVKPLIASSHVASACGSSGLQPGIICHDAVVNKKKGE